PPAPRPAVTEPTSSPVSRAAPAPRPAPNLGGTYGPVQRAETLWAIADRVRPDGVTINQMMIAIFQANPDAFAGNINVLRAGATLRLPEAADLDTLAVTAANSEVQRQTDEWRNRAGQGGQLRLLPPTDTAVARTPTPAPAPAPAEPAPAPALTSAPAATPGAATAPGGAENRPIEL